MNKITPLANVNVNVNVNANTDNNNGNINGNINGNNNDNNNTSNGNINGNINGNNNAVIQFDQSKFDQLAKSKELNPLVANDLREILSTCEIVLVCDDSDSMSQPIAEEGTDPFAPKSSTRWLELKKIAKTIIDFTTAINNRGLDIFFLNRGKVENVQGATGLQTAFGNVPNGKTPLVSMMDFVYKEKRRTIPPNATLLIVVVTDGEPTDGSRQDLYDALVRITSDGRTHVSFAECTDNAEDMEYLDLWDGKINNFDNTGDYREELARVKLAQGPQFKFDYTDYTIKILLATFLRWYFNLDQSRVNDRTNYPSYFQKQPVAGQVPQQQQWQQQQPPPQIQMQSPPQLQQVAGMPLAGEQVQMMPQYPPRFQQLVKDHELQPKTAQDLFQVLSTCDVVMICDDSGSMQADIIEPATNATTTRWMELKKLAAEIIKFVTAVNPSGLDIYFFGRPILRNVMDLNGLQQVFQDLPNCGTPMLGTLQNIYNEKTVDGIPTSGRQLLVVIVTDGQPGDGSHEEFREKLEFITASGQIHISIAECTDDESSMEFLDRLDGRIKNFDNTDDYREELARVRLLNGPNFKFDYGDYVIKILLATFNRWYFNVDQGMMNNNPVVMDSNPAGRPQMPFGYNSSCCRLI